MTERLQHADSQQVTNRRSRHESLFEQDYGISIKDLERLDEKAKVIVGVITGAIIFFALTKGNSMSFDAFEHVVQKAEPLLKPVGDIFLKVQCSLGEGNLNPYCD